MILSAAAAVTAPARRLPHAAAKTVAEGLQRSPQQLSSRMWGAAVLSIPLAETAPPSRAPPSRAGPASFPDPSLDLSSLCGACRLLPVRGSIRLLPLPTRLPTPSALHPPGPLTTPGPTRPGPRLPPLPPNALRHPRRVVTAEGRAGCRQSGQSPPPSHPATAPRQMRGPACRPQHRPQHRSQHRPQHWPQHRPHSAQPAKLPPSRPQERCAPSRGVGRGSGSSMSRA